MDAQSVAADLPVVRRWIDVALHRLGEVREEIDALNVYPVPDGDTGTNLYLTIESARAALVDAGTADPVVALRSLARGALLGARGNSGVIVAQLIRAGVDTLLEPAGEPSGDRVRDRARLVAAILARAADAGYEAVGRPVEGTILTVARAAADAAERLAAEDRGSAPVTPAQVVSAAREAADAALARTPEQLAALAAAGVVDAGGRGLCVLLEAAETVFAGIRRVAPGRPVPRPLPVPTAPEAAPGDDLSADGPAYEVMYLLDADDDRIPELRRTLAGLGDSLVVIGGDGLWNVHVHVDEVGPAIEAGIVAGRPHRLQVTHFVDQLTRARETAARPPRGVVAVAAGDGLAALFGGGGATVVRGGPGRRASTRDLLSAIQATGAEEVVVLPNDGETLAVAEAAAQAARETGQRIAVIPTRAQVQGLAAVAVHDPGRAFDEDVVAMTTAAGRTRHGGVTIAARDAITMAGPCAAGDVLGIVEGDFAVVGGTLDSTACQVVDRLLAGGGELVTLVGGCDAPATLLEAVRSHVETARADLDTLVYEGGQQRYQLLIGVE